MKEHPPDSGGESAILTSPKNPNGREHSQYFNSVSAQKQAKLWRLRSLPKNDPNKTLLNIHTTIDNGLK